MINFTLKNITLKNIANKMIFKTAVDNNQLNAFNRNFVIVNLIFSTIFQILRTTEFIMLYKTNKQKKNNNTHCVQFRIDIIGCLIILSIFLLNKIYHH